MKIRICLVFLLFSTICYAAGWDELNRVQIEDTLGDSVGVTGNSLEVVEDNSSDIKDSLDALDNAVAGNELQVDIVSGAVTGTEYTEGDTDATIGGIAIMWEDGSDTLRAVSATKPLPIDITDASVAVTGTFYQVTQPISGTVDITETSFDVTQATATNLKAQIFGDDITSALDVDASGQLQVDILTMPSTTITATNLDIRDLAVAQDDILIYANTVKDGSGTDLVPLVDADGNLQVDVLSMPTTAVTGTFWQDTQPISGNIGTLTTLTNPVGIKNAATDTITGISGTYDTIDVSLTNGTNRVTVDASGYLTTNINGTVSVDLGGNNDVTVTSGDIIITSGNITSDTELTTADLDVGAGTDTEAIVGLYLAKDGGAVLIGAGSAGDSMPINDDGGAITVDGAVTVSGTATVTQAGTVTVDLAGNNDVIVTSGDITETNSADIETALQIIDDWDDGDKANVNLNIAGTDVSAGSGVLTAQTQRVTLATDDEVNNDIDAIKTAIEKIDEDNISTTVATVYNVTMTDADTEYSQALTNVESLMFQCREEYDMRYAFVSGKVATPTTPWMTLKSGAVYSENFYDGAVDFTLYFASDETGKIAEIEIK